MTKSAKEEEVVTISKKEYQYLLDSQAHLDKLDARGVDNWGGYVGRHNYCDECDTPDIAWGERKCPNCGESLEEKYY